MIYVTTRVVSCVNVNISIEIYGGKCDLLIEMVIRFIVSDILLPVKTLNLVIRLSIFAIL